MKIIEINGCGFGSTGRIAEQVAESARLRGHEVVTAYPNTAGNRAVKKEGQLLFGSPLSRPLHQRLAYLTGREGEYSKAATRSLIRYIDEGGFDLVHLHNLHGFYLSLPTLFAYLRGAGKRVVWTLHDCWAFTGHCPHFDSVGCEKYRTGCFECPRYREYPASRADNSKVLYEKKREWFGGLPHLTLVTPSRWLSDRVGESFLCSYPREVIYNGVDTEVFRPREPRRPLSRGRHLIAACAMIWEERKGLGTILELGRRLGNDYRIALVGALPEKTELPENVVPIGRTSCPEELCEILSEAELFVNPTVEDTFPTVNLEALASGTPVLTYRTGGSPECIDERSGAVCEKGDIDSLVMHSKDICENHPFAREDCLARGRSFDKTVSFTKYVDLYERGAE